MQNDIATLKECLAVSYKNKYTLTVWSRNCGPWYLPKSVENSMSTQKPSHRYL